MKLLVILLLLHVTRTIWIYFPGSDIFVSLFSEPSGEENNNKNFRTRKIYLILYSVPLLINFSILFFINFCLFNFSKGIMCILISG